MRTYHSVFFITYGMFFKDKTKKYKSDMFKTQNWPYDDINGEFIGSKYKSLEFKRYAYRNDCLVFPLRNLWKKQL